MWKKFIKSASSILMGAILFLGLTTAAKAQSGNLIDAYASDCWDIAKDNNNRVYIMWFNKGTLYFGQIKDKQVTGTQIITSDVNRNLKYCAPHLSVQPNGKSMHVIYVNFKQTELKHAWRTGSGTWQTELAYNPTGKDKVYFQAGAVDNVGTVHAVFTKTGATRYTYKKPGAAWVHPIDLDNNNSEGTRLEVDSKGGIHCTWMPYKNYLYYRYAPLGQTLDKFPTEKIGFGCEAGFRVGIGDIFITKEGIVHQVLLYHRKLWHTSKPIGGTWPEETWVKNGSDTGLELRASVGADTRGRIFVSWGIATYGGKAMLSTFENGVWTPVSVGRGTNFGDYNDPSITVTDNDAYILWTTDPSDQMYLYSFPVTRVRSAINVGVQHLLERSFFKFYYFNKITWENNPFNITNHVQIDHYNIYRKAKSDDDYDKTPLEPISRPALSHLKTRVPQPILLNRISTTTSQRSRSSMASWLRAPSFIDRFFVNAGGAVPSGVLFFADSFPNSQCNGCLSSIKTVFYDNQGRHKRPLTSCH
jgi:hypothetical protein